MKTLVAAGDNCIDNYASLGEQYAGGNAVNIAVSFARDGGRAWYIGNVGTDNLGAVLKESVGRAGVDVSLVNTIPGRTAVTQVELVDGERVFGDYDEGVMVDFDLSEADLQFIGTCDLFVSAWWGNLSHRLADVRGLGTPVAFDFATEIETERASEIMPNVDYAFFSDERDPEDSSLRDLMALVQKRGPHTVVATLGGSGSLTLVGDSFEYCPVEDIEVVDTMGAGDSYIGGFLAGIARGEGIGEAMVRATRSAAYTLQVSGAW